MATHLDVDLMARCRIRIEAFGERKAVAASSCREIRSGSARPHLGGRLRLRENFSLVSSGRKRRSPIADGRLR